MKRRIQFTPVASFCKGTLSREEVLLLIVQKGCRGLQVLARACADADAVLAGAQASHCIPHLDCPVPPAAPCLTPGPRRPTEHIWHNCNRNGKHQRTLRMPPQWRRMPPGA